MFLHAPVVHIRTCGGGEIERERYVKRASVPNRLQPPQTLPESTCLGPSSADVEPDGRQIWLSSANLGQRRPTLATYFVPSLASGFGRLPTESGRSMLTTSCPCAISTDFRPDVSQLWKGSAQVWQMGPMGTIVSQKLSNIGGFQDNPAADAVRRKTPLWWCACQEVGGADWRHSKSNRLRGATDAVADLLGPCWPDMAADRQACAAQVRPNFIGFDRSRARCGPNSAQARPIIAISTSFDRRCKSGRSVPTMQVRIARRIARMWPKTGEDFLVLQGGQYDGQT